MPLLRSATSQPATFECSPGHVHSTACCGRRDFLTGLAALGAGAVLGARKSAAQAAAPAKPFRIDVHHHFSSPGFIAEITGRKTGQVPLMRLTAEKSLEDMDKGGVATSILSVSEPSVLRSGSETDTTIFVARVGPQPRWLESSSVTLIVSVSRELRRITSAALT